MENPSSNPPARPPLAPNSSSALALPTPIVSHSLLEPLESQMCVLFLPPAPMPPTPAPGTNSSPSSPNLPPPAPMATLTPAPDTSLSPSCPNPPRLAPMPTPPPTPGMTSSSSSCNPLGTSSLPSFSNPRPRPRSRLKARVSTSTTVVATTHPEASKKEKMRKQPQTKEGDDLLSAAKRKASGVKPPKAPPEKRFKSPMVPVSPLIPSRSTGIRMVLSPRTMSPSTELLDTSQESPISPFINKRHGWTMFNALLKTLQDWNIESKIFSITLDNASVNNNFVAALQDNLVFKGQLIRKGKLLHCRCAAYVFNLIVQEGFNSISSATKNIRDNVKYVKSSQARKQRFEAAVEKVGMPAEKQPPLDVVEFNLSYARDISEL